jgi:hypothetical protein
MILGIVIWWKTVKGLEGQSQSTYRKFNVIKKCRVFRNPLLLNTSPKLR